MLSTAEPGWNPTRAVDDENRRRFACQKMSALRDLTESEEFPARDTARCQDVCVFSPLDLRRSS